jgi:hypothetical protein
LEKEVDEDYRRHSWEREDIQKTNLQTAFSIVNPKTNTDLAFVVWCGDRYVPVADLAFRYRDSKQTGKSWCDHYPHISFDVDTKDVRAPNTAGIFAFKEELAYLLGELADLNIRDAMQALWSIYRGSSGLFFKRNTINVFEFQRMLKPKYRDRYTLEEIKRLYIFISECYGQSRYYSMYTITVERALAKVYVTNLQ